jgi:hypothetical protein
MLHILFSPKRLAAYLLRIKERHEYSQTSSHAWYYAQERMVYGIESATPRGESIYRQIEWSVEEMKRMSAVNITARQEHTAKINRLPYTLTAWRKGAVLSCDMGIGKDFQGHH